ncbi:MAG: Leucine-rich repeat (LRR) protein [Glaciecola sp.]|jgi:Leucine-rich repeat (LRR) protein
MRLLLVFMMIVSFFPTMGKEKYLNDAIPVYTDLVIASQSPDSVIQLVLKKKKYNSFPDEIWAFKNIEFLDLSKNKLDSIPMRIKDFTHLKVLKLSKNNISSIPPELYQLSNLEILVLSDNEMAYVAPEIANLTKLKTLDLYRTNVALLPEEISRLEHLKFVDLRGISLNKRQQSDVLDIVLKAKVYFSPPCNCNF